MYKYVKIQPDGMYTNWKSRRICSIIPGINMFNLMDQFDWVLSRGYVIEMAYLDRLLESAVQDTVFEPKNRDSILITANTHNVTVYIAGHITLEVNTRLTSTHQKELINEFLNAFESGREEAKYVVKERIAEGFNLPPERVNWRRFLNNIIPGYEKELI